MTRHSVSPREQRLVIDQLEARCANDVTWSAIPRGMTGHGRRPGFPGLCFIKDGKPLFIDMKRGNVNWNTGYNTVSDEQVEMHREITRAGGRVAICFGADETIKQLEGWGVLT